MESRTQIRNTFDAAKIMQKNFADADREYFVAVYLDPKRRPISYHIVSTGDTNSVHFPVSTVFKMALLQNASSVIVCHNHPGGSLDASNEDYEATRTLVEAGKMLGIRLLDHFILTPTDYISLREDYGELFS